MSKRIDPRQLYKDHYHIDFGPDMVVHHIDFDGRNNDIDNLILLPKKLHAKYHMCVSALGDDKGVVSIDSKIDLHGDSYNLAMIRHFADALGEIEKWRAKKESMDMALFMEEQNGRD